MPEKEEVRQQKHQKIHSLLVVVVVVVVVVVMLTGPLLEAQQGELK